MTSNDTLRTLIARPYIDRARHAAYRGRFREAEQHLEDIRQLHPNAHDVSLLIAKIRLREGRLRECREALLEARRLGHPESESDQMLSWLDAHASKRAAASHDRPATAPTGNTQRMPEVPRLERLGTSSDLLRSIAQLRIHLTNHPNCATARARMAEAIARKSLFWSGSKLMLHEAETQANRAIAISPASSEAHTSLGFVYGLQGAALDAERKLRQAIELDKSNWFALHELGLSLMQRGAHEQSARLLLESIERQPFFIPNYDAIHQAFLGLANPESAAKALDDGVRRANERLESAPDDLSARAHLAILLARKGMRTESLEVANQTMDRFPKSGFAWAHRAIAHAINGDSDDAIAALITAQERDYAIRFVVGLAEFDTMRNVSKFAQLGRA